MKKLAHVCALLVMTVLVGNAQADYTYSQDFSTDSSGWFGGTVTYNGVLDTATIVGQSYTQFGGYNFGVGNNVPTSFQEYTTSLDIMLDVDGGWNNDTRFDWDSAVSSSSGGFYRDFIFNAGFYNSSDLTGPGAGTNRFIISASNNSQRGSAYAKNPDMDPIAISTSGWYTFEHHFYNNGGVLAVDMNIFDSTDTVVGTWSLSNPIDLISLIGGSRYGWFSNNEFSAGLQIDNTYLETAAVVPIPGAAGLGLLGMGLVGLRRRFRKVA